MPSCSRLRRQLLHFHVVCRTWSIFQELTSIFSFRKRRLKEPNFSEIETNRATKTNICPEKHTDYVEIFLLLPNVVLAVLVCLNALSATIFRNVEPCLEGYATVAMDESTIFAPKLHISQYLHKLVLKV